MSSPVLKIVRDVAGEWIEHAFALAVWTDANLVNRRDAFGHYIAVERRKSDEDSTAITDKSGLTLAVLQRHYEGRSTGDLVGFHSTVRDEPTGEGEVAACWCRWLGIDIDRHDEATSLESNLKAALALYDRVTALGFRALLLDSNGRGGYHLIAFFDGPVASKKVYAFGRWLVRDWRALGLDADPETFPKQASIDHGGYGNWLRGPGRHHTSDHHTKVWDGRGWLEGSAAIKAIVATKGSPASLIPAEALVPPARPKRPRNPARSGDFEQDTALAASALEYLDPSMEYDDWLEIGMALTSLGREGLNLWEHWSFASDKYQEGLCDRKWRSFKNPTSGVKLGTLFHHAKARGFEFPKANNAKVGGEKKGTRRDAGQAEDQATADEPDGSEPKGDGLPQILISTDEFKVNDEAVDSLSKDPEVYCRGQFIVTVARDSASSKLITRKLETPRIAAMTKAGIRERLSKNAAWFKSRWNPGTKEHEYISAHPPDWSTAAVEARGNWPKMRPLEGVVEAPVLRPDGSILETPGYDEKTGLLYEPNCTFPKIPEKITREDARLAVEKLLYIIADFPFTSIVDDVKKTDDGSIGHRTAFLSSLLTPLARHAIAGPCPLFLVDGNTAASGKSKLCDIAAILATGREAARTSYPETEEEMRKQILSIALEGDRMMLIDNVATGGSFGGASLDGVLTACTVKGRILGRSQMSREIPIYTVWYATGINLSLRGDMLRRVIPYRLDSPDERPETRDNFRIKGDLLEHVKEHRGELVVAALTILRGYILAGRPDANLTPMDYPAWCRVVRNAIHWACGTDPCVTRDGLVEDDPETNMLKSLLEGWAELPNGTDGLTAAEAIRHLTNPDKMDRFGKLRDILLEWSNDGGIPGARSIGKRLKMFKGKVSGGKVLKAKSFNGIQSWAVSDVQKNGFNGFNGSAEEPTQEKSKPDLDCKKGLYEGEQTQQTQQTHFNDLDPLPF